MSRRFSPAILKPDQTLLLKAALLPPSEALTYWQHWKKARSLDRLDTAAPDLLPAIFDPLDNDSQRLMPLVYRHLEKSGDPLIPHLRGIYRYTWMNNQRFMVKVQQVVGALQSAGIDTMVLKGIPLSLRYYGDMGVRLMSDLDVLVPTDCAADAIRVLSQKPLNLRWSEYEYKYRHLLHAMHLFDANKVDVDLHWNLMSQHAYAGADKPFWAAGEPLTLTPALTTHTLSPTHQLFHNLIHGFAWGMTPAIRWVADSYVLYQQPGVAIDWHELLDLAQAFRLGFPVRQSLRLLQADFRLELPIDVVSRLNGLTLSAEEQTYFELLPRKTGNPLIKTVRYLEKHRLAHRLFRTDKPGPAMLPWLYGQLRFRLDWDKRDLPF